MEINNLSLKLATSGNGDTIDITNQVSELLEESGFQQGLLTVFTPSATSAITTIEYEPGCVSDLKRLFDEIVPVNRDYQHNLKWGDGNGHSHIRAALLKASFSVPFEAGHLLLGTWQHIVFLDFDNRPRKRNLVVQLIGG
ncbi:MAG: secondary thiamine-phosphate synthase enzyme YjbQ [Anaerolineales bacterium]|jgi:secondary thiamine-phosphate synthase enzyme